MSKHAAVLKRVIVEKLTHSQGKRWIGDFLLKDVGQETYDEYRNAFLTIYKDNLHLVPDGVNVEEHAKRTCSRFIHSFGNPLDIYSGLDLRIFSDFVSNTSFVDLEGSLIVNDGDQITIEDLETLENVDVDVEFRIHVEREISGSTVRFAVDKLVVKNHISNYF